MAHGKIETVASFTGTLLQRHKTADDKLVQLVFREGNKKWLCVSTNPADATWPVGATYQIEGIYKQAAGRSYIAQPTIAALANKRSFKQYLTFNRILLAAVILAVIISAISIYDILTPSRDTRQVRGASTTVPSSRSEKTQTNPDSATTQSQQTPPKTVTAPNATTSTTPKSTTSSNTSATTPSAAAPVVQTPAQTTPEPAATQAPDTAEKAPASHTETSDPPV